MISCQISIWMILRKIFVLDIMYTGFVLVPPSVCHLWLKVSCGSFKSPIIVTWHTQKVVLYAKMCLTIWFIRIIHAQIYKPSSWVDILMHFQFKNSFSHQIVRCAKGKVALKKNAFLELFLRTIEEDKWNLFEKLGQLRTPTLQKIKFPKDWFDIHIFHVFCCFLLLMMGTRICRNGW